MKKEVEIRIKLDSTTKEKVINNLKDLGWEPKSLSQKDVYYCAKEYYDENRTKECPYIVRIRTVGDRSELAYKSFNGGDGSSWIELETEVEKPVTLSEILIHLEQKNYLTIDKHRLSGRLDSIEINIDNILNLGSFIELEVITDKETEGRNQLIDLTKKIGVNDKDITTKGYVQLMEESTTTEQ